MRFPRLGGGGLATREARFLALGLAVLLATIIAVLLIYALAA
jgi:hypothetical protein